MSVIRRAWEQDLQINVGEAEWDDAVRNIHSSSTCARHSLVQFKVVHRTHLHKSKLARIYPHIDPTCDRCKLAEATLIHMFWLFWLCPKIQQVSTRVSFWGHCRGVRTTPWG